MNKSETRKLALQIRSLMNSTEIEVKSNEIQKKVLSLPNYSNSRCVMLYLNTQNEVQTTELARQTLSLGKRLIVPLCYCGDIIPCEISDMEQDLKAGMLGIREPRLGRQVAVSPQEIDIILVPGVAFDVQGNRIGFGKGYYDRLLPQLRQDVCIVGLAYSCQIMDQIEVEAHDYKMSLLISENGVIYPG